jgi:hypothetical protein
VALHGVHSWLLGVLVTFAAAVLMPATAEARPPAAAGTATVELPRVLPVWSNDSGRVEALLLVDDSRSSLTQSPLERLFAPVAPSTAPRLGLTTRLGVSRNVDLGLGLDLSSAPAMALLCDGNIGLAVALGRLSEQCLLTRLGVETAAGRGLQSGLRLSADWSSPSGELDFSFGLSWLNTRIDPNPLAAPLFDTDTLAGIHHSLGQLTLEGHEVSLQGSRWLGPRSWLRVEGRHSSTRIGGLEANNFGLPLEWDNTSLSLSGGYRRFSGSLTGRLIELDHPRQSWTDVDLNFSWRTPWDAKVSVGAKNLLGGPDRGQWPLSNLPGLPATESRTPYVRYHQDL